MAKHKSIPYPIQRTAQGMLACGSDLDQIKASLLTIILTRPGQRVCQPTFGTALHTLAGADLESVADDARQMIARAIRRWETRVQVTEIDVEVVPGEAGEDLSITVFFVEPSELSVQQKMVLQAPLGR